MPIPFRCPHCGHLTEVAERYIGQSGPCARCGQMVTITVGGGAGAVAAPRSSSKVWIIVVVLVVPALLLVGGCAVGVFFAVGRARQAARRTQDTNTVRQLVMGLHNYHDVNGELPHGTAGPAELPPERQLSWMAQVLPYVERSDVYQRLDSDQAWDAPANGAAARTPVSAYQSKAHPSGPFNADFVGIGGLGADAPTLPASNPRAGFFGSNRTTKFGDVIDGLSNTMILADTRVNNGPWAQGGPATVRGVDPKRPPYLGPGGQFGDDYGAIVALGDGSVRFVVAKTNPKVLEALSTIAGGEVVPPY